MKEYRGLVKGLSGYTSNFNQMLLTGYQLSISKLNTFIDDPKKYALRYWAKHTSNNLHFLRGNLVELYFFHRITAITPTQQDLNAWFSFLSQSVRPKDTKDYAALTQEYITDLLLGQYENPKSTVEEEWNKFNEEIGLYFQAAEQALNSPQIKNLIRSGLEQYQGIISICEPTPLEHVYKTITNSLIPQDSQLVKYSLNSTVDLVGIPDFVFFKGILELKTSKTRSKLTLDAMRQASFYSVALNKPIIVLKLSPIKNYNHSEKRYTITKLSRTKMKAFFRHEVISQIKYFNNFFDCTASISEFLSCCNPSFFDKYGQEWSEEEKQVYKRLKKLHTIAEYYTQEEQK